MGVYRLLLRLYPAAFRNEYAEEMVAIFERRLREEGPWGRLGAWLEALGDVAINATRLQAESAARDVRYSLRTLARAPAFSLTAIVVSALGIGATTAAFSITDHVLIRPLPFADPDRLVRLYQDQSFRGYPRVELSPANFRDWQRMATGFASMGAFSYDLLNLVGQGEPQRISGAVITSEVLPMLGVSPALGRVFSPEEDGADAPGTVVLSHALWQERFAGDPRILGQKILLSDQPYVVIGVMPRGFYFPDRTIRLWVPQRLRPGDLENRTNSYLNGIARLRDDTSIEQARAQLRNVAARLERQYPAENARNSATVVDMRTDMSSQARLLLAALFGAAVCVLLAACTNLGNLLLARSLGRQRELAIRTALGAGRERLVRQMLTESLILAGCGGAMGLAFAAAMMPLAARLVPSGLPIAEIPSFDGRILLFAVAITTSTAISFGLLPARRAGRASPSLLAEGGRSGRSRRTERLRSLLLVAEVAASVVLLTSAGLLIRALWAVQQVPPGFETSGVLTLRTALPLPQYESSDVRARFYDRILSDIRGVPGVTHAAYISSVPMGWLRGGIWPVTKDGRKDSEVNAPTASLRFVTPGFFSVLRIPLVAGRDIHDRDTRDAPFVAVVSESFAREQFPGQSPIGQRFFLAFQERIIVGVVGDVRVRGLERPSEPQVYLPHQQLPEAGLVGPGMYAEFLWHYSPQDLVVRSSTMTSAMVPTIRAIIGEVDSRLPVSDIRPLQDIVDGETAPRTVQLRVLAAFASVALLLAGIGVYGLVAYLVSLRTREIGVRLALGAPAHQVLWLVMQHALGLAGAGAALGLLVAFAAASTMRALLAGISPADASAFALSIALVLLVSLIGTLAPALRALRIDPVVAIRAE